MSRTRFMYHRSQTATIGFKMGTWCHKIFFLVVWRGNLVNNYAGVVYHGIIEKCLNVNVKKIMLVIFSKSLIGIALFSCLVHYLENECSIQFDMSYMSCILKQHQTVFTYVIDILTLYLRVVLSICLINVLILVR